MRKSLLGSFIKKLYRIAGHCAQKTFFQNRDDRQYFLDHGLIALAKSGLVAGSGVDISYFKPSEIIRNVSSEKRFTFLYVGRILWDKGIGELIEATQALKKRHPMLSVHFLGMIDEGNPAGISCSQIQKWEKEGLVSYLGEAVDVKPYLTNCQCVILPSFREGAPKALLEAAAMELPLITTDVPGCRDTVEHGITGFLVSARDSALLADAMEKMILLGEDQRKDMGKKGREKIIREFSESSVIKTYLSEIGL